MAQMDRQLVGLLALLIVPLVAGTVQFAAWRALRGVGGRPGVPYAAAQTISVVMAALCAGVLLWLTVAEFGDGGAIPGQVREYSVPWLSAAHGAGVIGGAARSWAGRVPELSAATLGLVAHAHTIISLLLIAVIALALQLWLWALGRAWENYLPVGWALAGAA